MVSTATPAQLEAIAPEWLDFIRAEEWGIKWKRPPVKEGLADEETYIHHGAGGRFGNDAAEAMRRLQRWYHDRKNYSTIAYDIMVHRSLSTGRVAVCGAREGWLSAATLNRNDIGEAICLFGYFHPGHLLSEHPSAREIEALAFAVAWSIAHGWSAPDTKVLGHRDNPKQTTDTSCPGDYLYPHVPHIARRAFELLDIASAPPPKPPDPYVPPTGGSVFYPVVPYRNSDTRVFGGQGIAPKTDHRFGLDPGKIPKDATAVAINVACVAQAHGWAALRPDGAPFTGTSTINFEPGATNGATIIGVKDLHFLVRLSQQAHVIIDVTGYFK